MTIKPETFFPLLKDQAADCSVLISSPDGFNLFESLESADTLSIAIAFGHCSGWTLIEKAILSANKKSVKILLGQAYFQTEPKLLLHLQREKDKKPFLDVRLANSTRTFHPKVWLIDREDRREAIVGSGNLSRGGLAKNVECGFYIEDKAARLQLDAWFTFHWELASTLSSSIQEYLNEYNKYHQRIASIEISLAVQAATSYWASSEGLKAVKQRDDAIRKMRRMLHYPNFQFSKEEWIHFLQTPEFGWIRLSHIEKTVAALPQLQTALKTVRAKGAKAIGQLEDVPGVGKNIASKLMVICYPIQCAVVNEPVIRALKRFGVDVNYAVRLDAEVYARFMRDLQPIIKAVPSSMSIASALDSFFIMYCD